MNENSILALSFIFRRNLPRNGFKPHQCTNALILPALLSRDTPKVISSHQVHAARVLLCKYCRWLQLLTPFSCLHHLFHYHVFHSAYLSKLYANLFLRRYTNQTSMCTQNRIPNGLLNNIDTVTLLDEMPSSVQRPFKENIYQTHRELLRWYADAHPRSTRPHIKVSQGEVTCSIHYHHSLFGASRAENHCPRHKSPFWDRSTMRRFQ